MQGFTCVKCGSSNVILKKKEMEFKLPNPGSVEVVQECNECQECGETYFDSEQMHELSKSLDNARKQ